MSRASEPNNEKKQQSKRWQQPTELQVISRIQKELAALSPNSARRVLSYVASAANDPLPQGTPSETEGDDFLS